MLANVREFEAVIICMTFIKEFEITEKENGGRFYVYKIPKKDWRERNPLAHDIILAIITALLSLVVGWLLLKSSNQEQETRDKKQESDILILTDSVNSLERKVLILDDSLKSISEENKKLKTKSE